MELSEFLNDPYNSRTRERIYFHRLAFDLHLAAARKGYHLQMFEPEVDRDGFDIVLNDGDYERHIQVKTVATTTSSWDISRRLARPGGYLAEAFGLDPIKSGLGGGFLLMQIDPNEGQNVDYFYADFHTLLALKDGMFGNEREAAAEIFEELLRDRDEKDIKIPKKVLLKAKRPDAVLGLMGLLNVLEKSLTPNQFIRYHKAPEDEPLTPAKNTWRSTISSTLSELTD